MRTKTLLIVLFILPFLSNGQEFFKIPVQLGSYSKYVNKSWGQVQVLDSTYCYNYNSGDWKEAWKKCITSRHWGTQGLPNEEVNYNFDDDLNSFVPVIYERTTFQNDSSLIPKEYFSKPFNSNINDWDNDTSYYFHFTGYYSKQFDEEIFRDKYMYKSYDYSTNNYTYGGKTIITLKDDTLYSQFENFDFNPATNKWKKYSKILFEYNSANYKQKMSTMLWDEPSQTYVNSDQEFYIFNNGNQIQRVEQDWNGSYWENTYKYVFEYGTNHELISSIEYEWDDLSSAWVPYEKFTYSYVAGLMTASIRQLWDDVSSTWENSSRITYSYNSSSLVTTELQETWTSGTWRNYYRNSYTYNSNNKLTSFIIEYWDNVSSAWIGSSKYTYAYDGNGNNTLYLYQNWDYMNSLWKNSHKTEYTYDSNNNNTLEIGYNWNNGLTVWEEDDKYVYYYSAFDATSINDIFSSNLGIFPNPTNGLINIDNPGDYTSITITDATGKVILEQENFMPQIDLRKYGTGLYVISMKTHYGITKTGKVIVQ